MLGSVIGLQAALQHSPYAFVVCSRVAAFFRLNYIFTLLWDMYFLIFLSPIQTLR